MLKMKIRLFWLLLVLPAIINAQNDKPSSVYYDLDILKVKQTLNEISSSKLSKSRGALSKTIELKDINGNTKRFVVQETPVLPQGLAEKFPAIKTYSGNCISNPSEKISVTKNSDELKLTLHLENGIFKVLPDEYDDLFIAEPQHISEDKDFENLNSNILSSYLGNACIGGEEPCYPIGDSLYVYRIGMILSKEANASVADGTVEGGLAWVADMVNRCNLVWVRDLASKLVLADSSHLLICTNDNKGYIPSPPHPSPTHFLLQYIQPMLDDLLGESKYEYGHLVTTGVGGGWAALNSPKGVSDPNYEVIIHEIGHQIGSPHNLTAEGGEYAWSIGGTIMGSRDNTVANNEGLSHGDQYSSHTVDIAIDLQRRRIGTFANGWYHESSGNSIPVITSMPESGFTIPVGTPFILEGLAGDADDDVLTYTWEQNDRATETYEVPDFPTDNGPLFVSVFPSTLGYKRYFPNMNDLLENKYPYKEQLPFSSREINMRMIVRDNNPECGSYTYKNVRFYSDVNSGPFKLLTANTSEIFTAGSQTEIKWDVANTDQQPVNCQSVTILLSTNGGLSFDYILAEETDNDGNEIVTLPNLPGNNNRMMIKAADNVFFDINDEPFTLHDPLQPGLFISFDKEEIKIIEEESVEINISTRGLGTINNDLRITVVNKPENVNTYFSNNDTTIVCSATTENSLLVDNLGDLDKGIYSIGLKFEIGTLVEQKTIVISKTGEVFTDAGYCLEINNDNKNNVVLPKFDKAINNFTFMAWIKPDGIQNPYSAIFCHDGDKTAALNFKDNNELGYHWEGGSWAWQSGLFADEGVWSHVAMVVNSNSITLYLNGKRAVHSVDAEEINFVKTCRLGSYKNWGDRNYFGLIDEVTFWNRSLDKDEIQNSMHGTMAGNEQGLLAYYQFNRMSAADAVGEYSGFANSGSSDYLQSSAPIGDADVSVENEMPGIVDFEGAGLTVNFSTQNGSEVVVARIKNEPNSFEGIDSNVSILNDQYWLYHRHSSSGIYLGNLTFEVTDLHSAGSYDLPEYYKLYNRAAGSDGEWKYVKDAVELDKSERKITFENVFATGQFLIANNADLTGIETEESLPGKFVLHQNYPNPFNPSTNIRFDLPGTSFVKVKVFDVLGNLLAILAESEYPAGRHLLKWNGENLNGRKVGSGLYILQITTEKINRTIKMVLMK